jgi:menaquinone-dependent protoporphyrinogen oxidase
MMRALVVTASKHGATAEIGLSIADTLNDVGISTNTRPAESVTSLDGYEVVILGSAVYMGRWMDEARHLAQRLRSQLVERDVWLFSSGPVGDPPMPSAEASDITPMMHLTRARGHRTFAGRLVREDLRFGEKAITKLVGVPEGDFLDRDQIRAWARQIAETLLSPVTA